MRKDLGNDKTHGMVIPCVLGVLITYVRSVIRNSGCPHYLSLYNRLIK